MAHRGRKKVAKSAPDDFVRRVRGVTKLNEDDFAKELGLPTSTVAALCQQKREVQLLHLELIGLACGAEPCVHVRSGIGTLLGQRDFTREEYDKWKEIEVEAAKKSQPLIKRSLVRTRRLLRVAASRKKVLVALYLLETEIRNIAKKLGLTELTGDFSKDLTSTFLKDEDIYDGVLSKLINVVDQGPPNLSCDDEKDLEEGLERARKRKPAGC